MISGYRQYAVESVVKTLDPSAFPAEANGGAMLQAESQNIRYTMDGTTPTTTYGMRLIAGLAPEEFLIDDVKRMKYVLEAGLTGKLNVHFFGGRVP